VSLKQTWGEERVTFVHPDGSLWSVPVGWTSLFPDDPYKTLGGGRSRFRVDDLLDLARLLSGHSR